MFFCSKILIGYATHLRLVHEHVVLKDLLSLEAFVAHSALVRPLSGVNNTVLFYAPRVHSGVGAHTAVVQFGPWWILAFSRDSDT